MNKCDECGSYAINHHCHGRDGSDPDLCDVCYWRKRATLSAQQSAQPEFCCKHSYKVAKQAAWGALDLTQCKCDHNEYCEHCWPDDFREGGKWHGGFETKQSAHVSVPECKLGIRGRAYDAPSVCRAYTYTEQPNNDHAWKLGKAASAVKAGGDYIDAGLSLLEQLQANGFGVFELRAILNGGEA